MRDMLISSEPGSGPSLRIVIYEQPWSGLPQFWEERA